MSQLGGKLLFELEVKEGPFEVRGQEQRRVIGTHATQLQSVPSSGGLSDENKTTCRESCKLGGCAICARSMWLEDLYDMQLFTEPEDTEGKPEGEGVELAGEENATDMSDNPHVEAPEEQEDDPDNLPAEAPEEQEDGPVTQKRVRFEVAPACVSKVDKLLNVERRRRRNGRPTKVAPEQG